MAEIEVFRRRRSAVVVDRLTSAMASMFSGGTGSSSQRQAELLEVLGEADGAMHVEGGCGRRPRRRRFFPAAVVTISTSRTMRSCSHWPEVVFEAILDEAGHLAAGVTVGERCRDRS